MNLYDFEIESVKKFNWLGWLRYEAAVRKWKDGGSLGNFPFAHDFCFFDNENKLWQTGYVAIHRTRSDIRIFFLKKPDLRRKLKQMMLIDYDESEVEGDIELPEEVVTEEETTHNPSSNQLGMDFS